MSKNYIYFNSKEDFVPVMSIPIEENDQAEPVIIEDDLPVIALRNTVLFPSIIIPINVGREKSLKAIEAAYVSTKIIGVVAQKNAKVENPLLEDLYRTGTYAKIIKLVKMPDGSKTAIIKGLGRFEIQELHHTDHLKAKINQLNYEPIDDTLELQTLISSIREQALKAIDLNPMIPKEAVEILDNIKDEVFLLDFIASNLNAKTQKKQEILEINNINRKGETIMAQIMTEIQALELKNQIENKVKKDIEKQQRDYLLNQQLKTIQQELGQNPQEEGLEKLAQKAKKKKWDDHVHAFFLKELNRAKRMNPQVAEYSTTLSHLELMIDLPWNVYTKDNFNLNNVEKVLNNDHYGLTEVKQRILEHLAVLKLKGDMKAPIICLVGPPGVGKTSLGKSVAKALKRKFDRISFGGLHDESEIRGHRKTYIGAMPGRIIKSINKAGSSNPVIILDEIDKIGKDFRGDPSSALLEVLDPEQNSTFHDNYLEKEYDLSKVLFIATANSLSTIQPALLDRMEIISLEGYSTEEKIKIAQKHLIPKLLKDHGLVKRDVTFKDDVLEFIISHYTKESGVRNLGRTIARIMRSIAKCKALDESYRKTLKPKDIIEYLGVTKFDNDAYQKIDTPGVVIGLAWTRVGGDILFIESNKSIGSGKLVLTGNLGDVMKESATTALSYLKANCHKLGIDIDVFKNSDIHIHVPQGAIPKDGPSAGITMLSALASLFLNKPVRPHLAMTGEITLRGKVLPVGGIKEKLLAAKRAGIKEIMLCAENKKHVERIDPDFIGDLVCTYVNTMDQVLEQALAIKVG